MKNKRKMYVVLSTYMGAVLFVCWSIIGFTQTNIENSDLSFKGKSNKERYVLGEPITVEFTFINESTAPLKVSEQGVETGGLKIFIARGKGAEYQEYFVSSWGRRRGYEIALEPNQSHALKPATILWNGKPDVSHLNENAGKQVLAGKITTEYAFPEPGVYFIKGRSYFGENATPIESDPIKVIIEEPKDDDLEVWKKIKRNAQLAILMQRGEFSTSDENKKQELIAAVEEIVILHPTSTYSSYLKTNLEKYKADELRRKQSMEKAKVKSDN